jgi:hypothetical protein
MNIIKTILKKIAKIIHFVPATAEEKIEYSKRQRAIHSSSKSNDTIINPATGLPMLGCLDVNGNSFGSSSSQDHCRRSNEEWYRSPSSTNYSSSYDPFTNRYQ